MRNFVYQQSGCGNDSPLSHKEVQEAADMAAPNFKKLVTEVVQSMGEKTMEV